MLILAAYETFCEDSKAAAMHLTAVRSLCHDEITNAFVSRLQANLELLALKHQTQDTASHPVRGSWIDTPVLATKR